MNLMTFDAEKTRAIGIKIRWIGIVVVAAATLNNASVMFIAGIIG